MTRTPSALGRAAFAVCNPDRKCPVCHVGTVGFGDFGCSPDCESIIADQIAAALVGAARAKADALTKED